MTNTHTHTHTRARAHTHTLIHTHARTHARTHIYTHTHTHTHIRTAHRRSDAQTYKKKKTDMLFDIHVLLQEREDCKHVIVGDGMPAPKMI